MAFLAVYHCGRGLNHCGRGLHSSKISHIPAELFHSYNTQNNCHKYHQYYNQHGFNGATVILVNFIVIPSQFWGIDRDIYIDLLILNLFRLALAHADN